MSARGWALAFAHLALAGLLGRIAFSRLGPGALRGDRGG